MLRLTTPSLRKKKNYGDADRSVAGQYRFLLVSVTKNVCDDCSYVYEVRALVLYYCACVAGCMWTAKCWRYSIYIYQCRGCPLTVRIVFSLVSILVCLC